MAESRTPEDVDVPSISTAISSDVDVPPISTATSSDEGVKSLECIGEQQPETPTNSDTEKDIQESANRDELLELLAKQLSYYLSTQNLSKDTYLNTIMELNSGHVPVSIVSNFANITRIITDNLMDDERISNLDVPGLVREAAIRSAYLEVAILNQNGGVIAKDEDGTYQLETGRLTFFAIGPTSIQPEHHEKILPLRRDRKQDSGEIAKSDNTNILILRDVPEEATEEDIRNILTQNTDTSFEIADVQREIGNCWFVTLGPTKSQQDMVNLLLSLRSAKICNEPIKVRLKTQRKAANNNSSAIETVAPSSPGYNPYRTWNRNKPAVPSRGYNNQVYTGDRTHYGGKKHYTGEKGRGYVAAGGYNKIFRGGRGGGGPHPDGELTSKGSCDFEKKEVQEEEIVLPPPSCEKNFPSLGGNSPKPTIVDANNNAGTEEKVTADNIVIEQKSVTPLPVGISSKEPATPTGGYAAALLKAVPNTNDSVAPTMTDSLPTLSTNKPHERKRLVPRHELAMNPMSTKSAGTSTTDDASSDGKSSLSSKPESEKSMNACTPSSPTIVTTTVISGGWGPGPSFADVLKKKETAGNKPVKN
eukprot:CAMPEP_0198255858 /NCGR_PEP_ID=MMETSP1447-20131203/5902_1 /TAXON_ID=420782 /ORGANISM="Chaetoceros dichaeta, Strain CCMP1751" /LENGTH=589 /DNA_ID=CAMNT_0043942341 /DNA_START=256 /DNA_END=2025 /DNA_ORIENTATION=+